MHKSLYGLSLPTLRLPLVLSGLILLTSCGVSPLSLLTGGGPNVAANVPIAVGETVEQNLGISIKSEAPTVRIEPNSRVDKIDQSTTNNVSIEPWMLLVMLCLAAGGAIGWVDNITRLFKRKK